jgi:hypothetical protein
LLKGSRAFYRGPKGIEKVTIAGVHHDAKLEPYYTIRFRDGKEKQTDGKCLTAIEEKREGSSGGDGGNNGSSDTLQRRGSLTTSKTYTSGSEQPTDQCSSSSSEHDEEERFHKGQDAYYRSSSGEGVTKIKIVERIGSNRYSVAFGDGTKRQVEGENLAGLIDLTSKELAGLMKEKNEKHGSMPDLRASVQSKESVTVDDTGYEPEAEPSSSENSYEDNTQHDSPGGNNGKKILSLPCAVQMVEAKTEEGGTKLVPLYKADMDVYYRGPQGVTTAHIVKTHLDDLLEPYYTIRLEDGREKQTDNAHISLEKPEEVKEEPEEDGVAEEAVEDDDWYQEWKENQLKQEQALRDEMKEFEDQEQSNLGSVEESTEPKSSVASEDLPLVQEKQERAKEEESELDPSMGALVPKNYSERAASERTESPVETPQVKKQDPDDSQNALVQAPQFTVGDAVLYNSSKGDHMRATVTKIRKDDKHRPYFVVKLSSGDEKKVYGHRLTPIRREGRDQRDASRTRSRSRSVSRRDRDREKLASSTSSKRSTSVDPRRLTRRDSVGSVGSRDASVDRSRCSSTRRKVIDRSRSMSRPPKETTSRGRRAESRDPRGRSHASESKESRSRSKSVRTPKDPSSRDSSENRQRARSRSRAPDDLKRSTVSRKAPMVMGVSHRVQHIGDEEGSMARSKCSTSRFGKLKSSISSGISKAKQRSFER